MGLSATSLCTLHPTVFPAPLHWARCTPSIPTAPWAPHPLPQYPAPHTVCFVPLHSCTVHPVPTPLVPSTPHCACTMYLTLCSLLPITHDLLCGPRNMSSAFCTPCLYNPVPLDLHPAPSTLQLGRLQGLLYCPDKRPKFYKPECQGQGQRTCVLPLDLSYI